MLRIFLSSHARLASGMEGAYTMLAGRAENLTTYDAYVDDAYSLTDRLDSFYANEVKADDEVLLLSDLYGGSVNTTMCAYLDRPNTRLVAGVNLAFLLGILLRDDEVLPDGELDELIASSRQALRRVNLDTSSCDDSPEDDFF